MTGRDRSGYMGGGEGRGGGRGGGGRPGPYDRNDRFGGGGGNFGGGQGMGFGNRGRGGRGNVKGIHLVFVQCIIVFNYACILYDSNIIVLLLNMFHSFVMKELNFSFLTFETSSCGHFQGWELFSIDTEFRIAKILIW